MRGNEFYGPNAWNTPDILHEYLPARWAARVRARQCSPGRSSPSFNGIYFQVKSLFENVQVQRRLDGVPRLGES